MDEETRKKTLDKLTKAENVLVAVPQSGSFDSLAAGLAICLSLEKLGKNVSIYAPSPTVDDAQRLYGVDKIGNSRGRKNLVVVVNNAVENVDKITYFLDDNKLKIVVHPLPQSAGVESQDISFEQSSASPDVIFSVGFNDIDELNREITLEQKLDPKIWIINISNNNSSQKFAQLNIINPAVSGVSELVGELMSDLALPLDEDIAFNLYSGLSHATDGFSPIEATESTFQVAAWLLKFGAGRASLAAIVSEPKSTTFLPTMQSKPAPQTSKPDVTKLMAQLNNLSLKSTLQNETPIEDIEVEKTTENDWLKPPKIYKGAKSFDREN